MSQLSCRGTQGGAAAGCTGTVSQRVYVLELHKPLRFESNQITWSVLEVVF